MSRDNFFILILIGVVGFLLYTMNSGRKEHFDAPASTVLENIAQNKNSAVNLNSGIIDTIGQKLAEAANKNLGSLVTPPSKPAKDELIDIFKDQPNVASGAPLPNSNKMNAASLSSSSTFNFDGLNNANSSNLNSGDLLPVDNDVNEYNINKPPISYYDANLTVNTIEKIGVDTQGSSKKNASQDLRGNVPCPKFVISPWNNSTIDPDTNIKGMYA